MTNNKEIIKDLKLLKEIKPDESFINRTRNIVLVTTPHSRLVPAWIAGLALAAVVLALIGSGILFSTHHPSISSSLNEDFLVKEFSELDINIQIDEITYSQDVHKTIASALNEISDSRTSHMNPSILEAEKEYINQLEDTGSKEKEINNLLNKVIF